MGPEEIKAIVRQALIRDALGEDALMTEQEVADYLETSKKTVERLRKAGELTGGYIGDKPRYSLGQVRRFSRSIPGRKARTKGDA